MEKQTVESLLEAIEGAENYLAVARSKAERLMGVKPKKGPLMLTKSNGKPSFSPPTKKSNGAVKIPEDISVVDRKQLVVYCHQLGYDASDTKGKRVKTLRQMIKDKQDIGESPKRPQLSKPTNRPTLTKPAKPFRPKLSKRH